MKLELCKLNDAQVKNYKSLATNRAIWRWKRDEGEYSKTIYFNTKLVLNGKTLCLEDPFLFYRITTDKKELEKITDNLHTKGDAAFKKVKKLGLEVKYKFSQKANEKESFELEIGKRDDIVEEELSVVLQWEPFVIGKRRITPTRDYDLKEYAPFAALIGSGFSHESDVSPLGEAHQIFSLDNITGEILFDDRDLLARDVMQNPAKSFKRFCLVHKQCILAKPNKMHELVKLLVEKDFIRHIYTDNIDPLLEASGIKLAAMRLPRLMYRFKVNVPKDIKSLLVIGVAGDRRELVQQFREAGKKIIVINPGYMVSPRARDIDYLLKGDLFYKEEASDALPKIAKHLIPGVDEKYFSRKRVLLTGAAGRLGTRLLMEMPNRFWIVGFSKKAPEINDFERYRRTLNRFGRINITLVRLENFIEGVLTKTEDVDTALEGIDTIVHLPSLFENGSGLDQLGTTKLLNHAKEKGIKKLILVSPLQLVGASEKKGR